MIKTLLYTGIRVSELISVKISDINFDEVSDSDKSRERRERSSGTFPTGFQGDFINVRNTNPRDRRPFIFLSLHGRKLILIVESGKF
jgi:integrase